LPPIPRVAIREPESYRIQPSVGQGNFPRGCLARRSHVGRDGLRQSAHNEYVNALPRPQLFAFIEQMSATERNLTHGLQLLVSPEFRSADLDVVLRSLARGSETLVKLTRILAHLHHQGALPPELRGHRVDQFEPEVRRMVTDGAEQIAGTGGGCGCSHSSWRPIRWLEYCS
jgi:hypothetical protein